MAQDHHVGSNVRVILISRITRIGKAMPKYIVALSTALLIGTILILSRGEDPLFVLKSLLLGPLDTTPMLMTTLRWATPLIISGIANIVAFRAGVTNIGVEGQLLSGALFAAIVGYAIQGLPTIIHISLVILAGAIAGMMWVFIPAVLNIFFEIDEIITTLMMNYIALLFTEYLIRFHFGQTYIGDGVPNWVTTPEIAESAKLSLLYPTSQLSSGILIAIFVAGLMHLIFKVSIIGYESNMLGLNRRFVKYGGVRMRKTLFVAFFLSGAIAGIAGALEVAGAHYRFDSMFPKQLGFDGIMVSLLANNSAIGAIPAGFFLAILKNGSFIVERVSNINRVTVSVIQAIILLFFTIQIKVRNSNASRLKKKIG